MIRNPARRFRRDEAGGLTVEAVLVLPFLLWAFVATFVFFDAYRTQGITLKAAYTIGDTLSRETAEVDYQYINGLNQVFDFLTFSPLETRLRVTVVTFIEGQDDEPDRHNVDWSAASTEMVPEYDNSTFDELEPDIPAMANGDQVIVVDTWMSYVPSLGIGLEQTTMFNRLVTRPRFTPQLVWDVDSTSNTGWNGGTSTGTRAGVTTSSSSSGGGGSGGALTTVLGGGVSRSLVSPSTLGTAGLTGSGTSGTGGYSTSTSSTGDGGSDGGSTEGGDETPPDNVPSVGDSAGDPAPDDSGDDGSDSSGSGGSGGSEGSDADDDSSSDESTAPTPDTSSDGSDGSSGSSDETNDETDDTRTVTTGTTDSTDDSDEDETPPAPLPPPIILF